MMKKSMISVGLIIAVVLSFSTSVFAAYNFSSQSYYISSGSIEFGHGVIANTGTYRDDLKIDLYRGTTLVATKTITLSPGEWLYPGSTTTPLITLATNQPAGQYRYVLSASGSWNVKAYAENW
ncbi:hypothetical protein [Paenibacillus sp. GSMTC-2017]|uniref:hypothetical protein n=1 Tax=Paenibacillus sp. GSMTC-2017 TaxID=2794350 RepID=UPI001E3FCCAF|nr:hypothetical protein [Paenibacillus sp. GSMTC-2017]